VKESTSRQKKQRQSQQLPLQIVYSFLCYFDYYNECCNWSSNNNIMNTNRNKTKQMLITTNKDFLCNVHSNNNSLIIERVYSFKLIGITVDDNLQWGSHVNSICAKVSSRLRFLKILKPSSLSTDGLLYFYMSTAILFNSFLFYSIHIVRHSFKRLFS